MLWWMAYRGSLGEIDLPSALQVLCHAGRSGVVTVEGDDCSALIVLERGRIVFASTDALPRIGERFVNAGLVTPDQLSHVLNMQRKKKTRRLLGQLLVDLAFITEQQAAQVVEDQIVAVFADTLTWRSQHVHFDEGDGTVEEGLLGPDRGDVESLLVRAMVEGAPG